MTVSTDRFWTERPILTHIHQYAQARRVSPWATFGGVLARVVAATEPRVQLPAIVGGPGSLNLFVGIVGRSGQGKGASQAAAAACLTIADGGALFETVSVGSGEGLAASFVQRRKDDDGNLVVEQYAESALFDVAEVDSLTALAGRQGSTLLSELRKVWSGERLGFQNRDMSRTLPVEAHAYRASLVIGIQPARAGVLLDDVDGGTPQRFIWLPATDDDAPDVAPPTPLPKTWFALGEVQLPTADGSRTIHVCDEAKGIIDRARVARLRGDGEALDGHALFTQLKVAAALGILDGRGEVTEDDWRLAGVVMTVSDATRASCRDAIRDQSKATARARAEARAEANVVVADRSEAAAIELVKQKIIAKLTDDWTAGSTLRSGITASLRQHFETAVEQLAASGAIFIEHGTYQGQNSIRLRLGATSPDNSSGRTVGSQNPQNSGADGPDGSSRDRADGKSWLDKREEAA